MAHRQQGAHTATVTEGSGWLATLVETFERTERLGEIPCDANLISVARSKLQQTASADGDQLAVSEPAAEFHH